MDNLVTGVADEEGAIKFFRAAREIMLAAGMNLRKWKSSSHLVMDKIVSEMASSEGQRNACSAVVNIEEEDETYVRAVVGHSVAAQNQASRILGVMWDHVSDTFGLI